MLYAAVALVGSSVFAQSLEHQIARFAYDAHGTVAVACALPGTDLTCDLNPHAHPPMQSVFKLPLALTVFHLIEQGRFRLDHQTRFLASDRILPQTVSPLQDKYPAAEVDVAMNELLRLTVVESDNAAADVLLRTIGGPKTVQDYIASLEITGFHLEDNEAALHQDVKAQYRNWFEPAGAVQLLLRLANHSPINGDHTEKLLGWMRDTPRGNRRLKGLLRPGTVTMHKPGSSGTDGNVTQAWNDIGLIVLPDGRRLAIAVFITDATANEVMRDYVIARIAKAAYEAALVAKPN